MFYLCNHLLRHRLHERGFQSKRFHDLETASKTTRFQGVYTEPIQPLRSAHTMRLVPATSRRDQSQGLVAPCVPTLLNPTVYVNAISFSGLCASSIGARFDQTRVRRLSSPRPNPESSLAFLFVTQAYSGTLSRREILRVNARLGEIRKN